MKLKKYNSQKSNDLNKKLKSYTALTTAFLLGAGAAHGQVIFTDIDPDTLIEKASFDIDMDHDGITDFGFLHYTYYTFNREAFFKRGVNPANRAMAVRAVFYNQLTTYPLNLPAGNPIGPGGPFFNFNMIPAGRHATQWIGTSGGGATDTTKWAGGFFVDEAGYIGVEFRSNGNIYYGWIECGMDSMANGVTIKGYAYESTPNTYLLAGEGGAIGISKEPTAFSPASSFFPNPVTNGKTFIRIESQKSAELTIEIMNGIGQVLQNENRSLSSGKNVIELNVSSLANGTYFVKIMEGEAVFFRKILISK